MIVKRVPRKQKRSSNKAVRAHATKLGRYIINAREEDARALSQFEDQSYAHGLALYATTSQPEKVVATKAKNFRSDDDLGDQLKQMDELLAASGSSKDLVDHWIMSWDPTDKPTVTEMFDAFDIFDMCLAIEACPSITAIHGNTDNPHGHKAVLRIDPETGKTIARTHDGWDIDAAHRAIAVIAGRYPHWKVTTDRIYDVRNGRLIHRKTNTDVGNADDPSTWIPLIRTRQAASVGNSKKLLSKIDHHSLQYEQDSGWKSRKRVAIEEAVPILLNAADWQSLHAALGTIGIGLERSKYKNGANLDFDGKTVGASIHDSTSFGELVERLGPFQQRRDDIIVAPYVPRSMHPKDVDRQEYHAAKRAFAASLAQMISEIRASDTGYKSSAPSIENDPSKLTRLSFPSFEAWMTGMVAPDPCAVLQMSSPVRGLSLDGFSLPYPVNYPGYDAQVFDKGVAYRKADDPYSPPAIFDVGVRIYVNDDSDASIRVALRIMHSRKPGQPLRAFGPPEFRARVEKIAAAENILIKSAALTNKARESDQSNGTPAGDGAGAATTLHEKSSDLVDTQPSATTPQVSTPPTQQSPVQRPCTLSAATEKADAERPATRPDAAAAPSEATSKEPEVPAKPNPQVEAAKAAAAAAMAARWGRG